MKRLITAALISAGITCTLPALAATPSVAPQLPTEAAHMEKRVAVCKADNGTTYAVEIYRGNARSYQVFRNNGRMVGYVMRKLVVKNTNKFTSYEIQTSAFAVDQTGAWQQYDTGSDDDVRAFNQRANALVGGMNKTQFMKCVRKTSGAAH